MLAAMASEPVAHAILVLALVSVAGLAIGSLNFRGMKLGTAGVLFAGILFGHFGWAIEPGILDFVKEFGLILFVFTIGLQLGPGFIAALRKQGLPLNLLAAGVVVLGAGIAILACWILRIDFAASLGLFSGATTNTPSLGAGQQALSTLTKLEASRAALPALAYAVAYPVGIAGILASLVILRKIYRIDPVAEAEAFRAAQQMVIEPLERANLLVENQNLAGLSIGTLPGRKETGVIVSRIRRKGMAEVETATDSTLIQVGDAILTVGTRSNLTQFQRIVGRVIDVDLTKVPGSVAVRRVVVTRKEVLGKSLQELALADVHGVTVTRVTRADLEMTAVPELRLQFGDMLMIVGDAGSLNNAAIALGNSVKTLNETHFIPIFIGITLGVLAGSIPFAMPGLPAPVRLGLAGGPLILAIILSRIGRIGPVVWHMPVNSNLAFRELGIILFLACVGLKAGVKFFEIVFTGTGVTWLMAAVCITVLPMMLIGVVARSMMKLNFVTISGLLAGSMTDPPALAFACALSKSDSPSVAYATVYPLTMLLRIITAQVMALLLCG